MHDSKRFVRSNRWVIEHAPLQLYSSALIFCPTASKMRYYFRHLIPRWITQKSEAGEGLTSEHSTFEGSAQFESVAFSPKDDLLVSLSFDGTTSVWNYVTGTELYHFETSSNNCRQVAFSPDGKTVASALGFGLIQLREFGKGRSIYLIGHSGQVSDLAFSPKTSNTLASIGDDNTLRIWDVEKGCAAYSVEEPGTEYWSPLAFSPTGEFMAVGCGSAVRLRRAEKGELMTTFGVHTHEVNALAISMDGETVV